ncbi:MAG: exosortase [Planctomycetota bacterium]
MVKGDTIRVIILAGQRDFGRSRLAADLPAPLWPVAGKPALQRILDSLAAQGIVDAVICSNGQSSLLSESVHPSGDINVSFMEEVLPVGTAGALRDAARGCRDVLFVVVPASMVSIPDIQMLLEAHNSGKCDLTVMFNPDDGNPGQWGSTSGIHVCSGKVLEYIPSGGYFDIKEGLVPEMVRAGKSVHAAVLPRHVGNFRDRPEYLRAISDYLENPENACFDKAGLEQTDSGSVWIAKDAEVHSTAKVCGPAVIMGGAKVSAGAVILGPSVLENDVEVGADTVIVGSVVWDGATLEGDCQVQRSLVGRGVAVPRRAVIREESISGESNGALGKVMKGKWKVVGEKMRKTQRKTDGNLSDATLLDAMKPQAIVGIAILLVAFLWSYMPELTDLWTLWQRSDEYSSGLLVPFLAIYILWTRREDLVRCATKPAVICGILAFVGAQGFRFYGLFYNYRTGERISVVLSVGALVLLIFVWRFMWKVFTVLLFMLLMIPWPRPLQEHIATPLQSYATTSAVFCLELLGYGVRQYGNVIDIEGTVVEVAFACNGLRMITAFFVISGLVALLVNRPLWQKIFVFVSSLPIALLCNTVRLTLTSIAFTMLKGEKWEEIFHDFGGYAMMPLALAAVVGELWLLKKLTTAPVKKEAIVITRQNA